MLIEQGHAPAVPKEERLRHHALTEIGIRHSLFIADIHTGILLLTPPVPSDLLIGRRVQHFGIRRRPLGQRRDTKSRVAAEAKITQFFSRKRVARKSGSGVGSVALNHFLGAVVFSSASIRSSSLMGLGIYSSIPAAMHCSRHSEATPAVMAMIVTCRYVALRDDESLLRHRIHSSRAAGISARITVR